MANETTKAKLEAAEKKLEEARAEVAAARDADNARRVTENKGGLWFMFSQNNTRGSFVVDERVCETVIIEADSAETANARAETFGVYFGGCALGRDCSCCGDRWYRTSDDDGKPEPMVYDEKASEYVESFFGTRKAIYVYPLVGEMIIYRPRKKTLEEYDAERAARRAALAEVSS